MIGQAVAELPQMGILPTSWLSVVCSVSFWCVFDRALVFLHVSKVYGTFILQPQPRASWNGQRQSRQGTGRAGRPVPWGHLFLAVHGIPCMVQERHPFRYEAY